MTLLEHSRGTIAFSHANGFPAGTYRLLFEAWRAAGYTVIAIDKFAHDPAHSVSNNWPRLREQLLLFIERQAPGERVHLVGHSLGGFLSLLAACKRPTVARSLVLIDSPLVAGWRAHGLHVAKVSGLIRRGGPGRVSARRRWQWPDRDAAHAHFASKNSFARWHPEVLRDYIASGTEPDERGVRLAFKREVETQIYETLPHNMASVLRRHPLQCPAAYIGGTRSVEGRQAGFAATRKLVGERVILIEGSHLFPMEKPAETAEAVLQLLPD
ncbi:MAG TPA: alpha/beta hydrolase [Rubrivivax sp.]|nr:alpha/beta hydrolase [Rubrivivax sp.]